MGIIVSECGILKVELLEEVCIFMRVEIYVVNINIELLFISMFM